LVADGGHLNGQLPAASTVPVAATDLGLIGDEEQDARPTILV